MQITLTNGKAVTVDDEDYHLAAQYRWHEAGGGYAAYGLRRTTIYLHRIIAGAAPGMEVDHINGDTSDNRRANLRIATHQQNLANQRKQQGRTSQYKGVSWDRKRSKWVAQIKFNRQGRYLGVYTKEEDAARAYDTAARHYFGEFARLNFSEGS